MKKILLLASVTVLLFASCKKDEKCEIKISKVAGTYRVTAAKYKQTPASAEIDLFASLDACEKDDLEVLNENGSYTHQDAGTACSPNGTYSGTWTLNGNAITIDGEAATIQSFDCSTLVFVVAAYLLPGDAATFTLAKQ